MFWAITAWTFEADSKLWVRFCWIMASCNWKTPKKEHCLLYSMLRLFHRCINQRPTGWLLNLTRPHGWLESQVQQGQGQGAAFEGQSPTENMLEFAHSEPLTDFGVSMLTSRPLCPLTPRSIMVWLCPLISITAGSVHTCHGICLTATPSLGRGVRASANSCFCCWTRTFWEPGSA